MRHPRRLYARAAALKILDLPAPTSLFASIDANM